MDANLVYFVLGVVVSFITSIVANRYDSTFKGWSETWRLTNRLKRLAREKTLYGALLELRDDAAKRETYMDYLRTRMTFFLLAAVLLTCSALLWRTNIKPELSLDYWLNIPVPQPPALLSSVIYWLTLLAAFYCGNVGILTFFKIIDFTRRFLEFDAYRARLVKEWPDSEWR
jgi:hypothetical protein